MKKPAIIFFLFVFGTLSSGCNSSKYPLAPYEIVGGKVKSITLINELYESSTTVEFDEKGRLIHPESNLVGRNVNEDGTVSYIYYNPIYEGESQEEIWTYNSSDLLIELQTPYDQTSYTYDKKLRIINTIEYAEGNISITDYVYDKNGNLTHMYIYEGEEAAGNVIKIEANNSQQQFIITERDEYGNWLQRTVLPSWRNRFYERREITYWD